MPPSMLRVAAALTILCGLTVQAQAFDLQSTTVPGRAAPSLTNGEIAINRADGGLSYKAPDGSIARGLLPDIDASGYLKFRNGPTLGRWQDGKFVATPERIVIQGAGSTGDASGLSVTPSAGAAAETLARQIFDKAPQESPTFKGIVTAPTLALTGDGSTGPVGGMSVLPSGATARLTVNQYLSRLPLTVAAFGAVGDGSVDDAPALNRAIQAACARGGGIVLLMQKHRIAAPIDNPCDGVLVQGIGGEDIPHDSGAGFYGTVVFPAPGYTGNGLVHRTRTATEQGIAAAANKVVTGGGFTGITATGFRRNLLVTSVRRGTYRLTLLEATGPQSALFDSLPDYRNGSASQLGEASDTQGMTFDVFLRQYDNGTSGATTENTDGVWFDAVGAGNVSYNFGMRLNARVHNGVGWRAASADNNVWDNFRVSVTGNGKPFVIQANTATHVNDTNIFNHYYSNVPGYVEGPGDRANSTAPRQTTINVLDVSNNSAVPTAGAGTSLVIVNGNRQWSTWAPALTPATGSYTSTILAEARYRRLALDNTVSFTLTFSVSYTSASGDLRFTLPTSVVGSTVFTGREASTGRMMHCGVGQNSNLVSCTRFDSTSPLGSGSYYVVSGSYEMP